MGGGCSEYHVAGWVTSNLFGGLTNWSKSHFNLFGHIRICCNEQIHLPGSSKTQATPNDRALVMGSPTKWTPYLWKRPFGPGDSLDIPLEGLGSILNQALQHFGRGSYCKGIKWLKLNASQGSLYHCGMSMYLLLRVSSCTDVRFLMLNTPTS